MKHSSLKKILACILGLSLAIGSQPAAVSAAGLLQGSLTENYDTGSCDGNIYTIASALKATAMVNVYNTLDENGTNISLWQENGDAAQKFLFVYDGDGYYHFLNIHSWKAVDVAGGSIVSGANVQQWDYNASSAQEWRILKNTDGTVTFKNRLGTVMDISGGRTENLTNIQTYAENGTSAQKWKLKAASVKLSQTVVSLGTSARIAYTGKAAAPQPEVKLFGRTLTQDKDYTLSYENNVQPGTAYVTVTGTGSFTGTVRKSFAIYEPDGGLDPEGTYVILSKVNPDLAVDVSGGGIMNGTRLWLYGKNGTEAQRFSLSKNDDGTYSFTNAKSELSIDVAGNSPENEAAVQVYEANGTSAQKWIFRQNEDRTYTIVNSVTGKVLDVPGGQCIQGNKIQMYDSNGSDAQKFYLEETAVPDHSRDGVYVISSAMNAGFNIDAAGTVQTDGTNIQAWQVTGGDAQKYRLQYCGDGYYRIISELSGKVLDVKDGSTSAGANVQLYSWMGTAGQMWKIVPQSDGSFVIQSRLGCRLDLQGNTANGTNVCVYSESTSPGQRWYLLPTGRDEVLTAAAGQRTVLSLLQNALKPVGRTLYILDGGWNYGNIAGEPVDAHVIGYQDAWWDFFSAHAQPGYDFSQYLYKHGSGLDCSGYVHWAVYNTLFDTDGQGYDLPRSLYIADSFKNNGWAVTGDPTFHPGDIVSIDEGNDAGHVYIVLGTCSDGSILFAHTTLVPFATQGAGCQLSGTSAPGAGTDGSTVVSEASKMAKAYMDKYFPEWPYAQVVEPYETYASGKVVKATWITDGTGVMSDAEGLKDMNAGEIMKILLGEA